MGKLFDHYHPERYYMRGPGPKWLEKQAGGHPAGDVGGAARDFKLAYRGYDLEVAHARSIWRVGIHPRRPELPILRRCEVFGPNQDAAIAEAKRRVDAAVLL